jgi:bifunctional N-acetylglucosamine-1-phosphate-uridyltransferase/glucosamine-1-phosphate-acetyltransferase GlmU-like protein
MLTCQDLFDLSRVAPTLRPLLEVARPWEVLAKLDAFCAEIPDRRLGEVHPTAVLTGSVYLEAGATVGPHVLIEGPAWIAAGAEVGHGAYLRGGVVLAAGAKVGHATEVKRALFLEGAKAPHFNYVGDTVLGRGVNLGAGVKLANLKAFGDTIEVAGERTGVRKFGAALGDGVSIGCNAVTAPGTIVGARTVIYHGATVRGVIAADTVVKLKPPLETVPRRGP